jgi:hypothetical protein
MEKRHTRRIFPIALLSNTGKTIMIIKSRVRVMRSRFLKAVVIRLCGMIHPSGSD